MTNLVLQSKIQNPSTALRTGPKSKIPERRWVLIFAGLVILASSLPYLLGYFVQDSQWRFTGFVLSVEDGNGLVGRMYSGSMGDWLFRSPYTASYQRGFLIYLPYLLLGKLASPPGIHEQLVALYHLFRVASGALVILATYDFISFFVADYKYRRFGLVLATLGGGLGWILVLLRVDAWNTLPLDFYTPENFGFLNLYVYPHYALARALMLWGLVAYLRAVARLDESLSAPKEGMKIGVLLLLAGLSQWLTGIVAGMVIVIHWLTLAAWQLWRAIRREPTQWARLWRMTKLALWASLLPAPFVLYTFVSSHVDPFLKMWTEQSYFLSPHPFHYLLAYGLIGPFLIVGGRRLWLEGDWTAKLPVAWVIFLPVLAYAPVSVQRRLPEAIWVAMVTLAMAAVEGLKVESRKVGRLRIGQLATLRQRQFRWRAQGRLFALRPVTVLLMPSTAVLLALGLIVAARPAQPAFRPAQEVVAFEWLAENAQPGDGDTEPRVVLAAYDTGNALPAWAPLRVVIGHGPESVGLAELSPRVAAFYRADTPDADRLELLRELHVRYVFWGPAERALGEEKGGQPWHPSRAPYLREVYRDGEYVVYEVSGSW